MDDDLVARIYEAAVVQEAWPDVLAAVADRLGAWGGMLLHKGGGRLAWTATENNRDLAAEVTETGLLDNEWLRRYAAGGHLGFAEDRAVFGDDDPSTSEMYTRLLHPRGLGHGCGAVILVPNGDSIVIGFERRLGDAPFDAARVRDLDLLRPHIARAAMVAGQFDLARAATAVAALQALGLPALVVGRGGRVRGRNHAAESASGVLRIGAADRLSLGARPADRLLAEALAGLPSTGAGTAGSVRSIPVPAGDDAPACVVHVVPISRGGHDVFAGAEALVVVTTASRRAAFDVSLLQGCFDLTAAEARVAAAIAGGRSLDDHAVAAGVSRETVRTHLKRALAKTGTSRQHELAALLAPIAGGKED